MPSVWVEEYKTKRGTNRVVKWEIYVPNPKGGKKVRVRGHEVCGPSKAYAHMRAGELRKQLYQGKTPALVSPRDLFGAADQYLAQRRGVGAPSTYTNFVEPAIRSFRAFKGNCLMGMLELQDFVKWRDDLGEDYEPATVFMRLRDVNTFLNWAEEEEIILRNPIRKLKKIAPDVAPVGRYVTPEEVDALLPELPARVRKACYFGLYHGARRMEMVNLDWKSAYTAALPWTLEIQPPAAVGIDKPDRIKTRQSRMIEVDDNVRDMLGAPQPAGQLIAGLTADMINSHLAAATGRLSLGRIRYHDFRHTAATNFMWRHGDIFRLMREFGWSSLGAVKGYQHYTKRQSVPDYRRFPQYFPKNTVPRERRRS